MIPLSVLSILFITVILFACAPAATPIEKLSISEQPVTESRVSEKDPWQVKWEQILESAKKEGQVVIYSTQTSNVMRQAVTKTVKEKFGINLDIIVGKGAEIASKVLMERNTNLFMADVYFGGPTTPLATLKPLGALIPLEPLFILPEVIDPKYWEGGKLGWVDKDHYLILMFGSTAAPIAINISIVKPGEITSYYDILNPKWKGKIIMNDPTVSGTGGSGFAALGWHILNLDYFYQLAKQEPVVVRDRRLQAEWLARGKYGIHLFPNTSITSEFREAGAPLALVVPKEGTYTSSGGGGLAVFDKAPHPNAARVFVNWALSQEGQTIISNTKGSQSLRIDVKTEGLDPAEVRQEGVKYFLGAETEDFVMQQDAKMKIAEEIFGTFIIK